MSNNELLHVINRYIPIFIRLHVLLHKFLQIFLAPKHPLEVPVHLNQLRLDSLQRIRRHLLRIQYNIIVIVYRSPFIVSAWYRGGTTATGRDSLRWFFIGSTVIVKETQVRYEIPVANLARIRIYIFSQVGGELILLLFEILRDVRTAFNHFEQSLNIHLIRFICILVKDIQ